MDTGNGDKSMSSAVAAPDEDSTQMYSNMIPKDVLEALESVLRSIEDTNVSNSGGGKTIDWKVINGAANTAFFIAVVVAIVMAKVLLVNVDHARGWTLSETMLRIPPDNWIAYLRSLDANPVFVKAVTSGSVYSLGDVLAQLSGGKEVGEIDRPRVLKSMAAGFVGHGPLSHEWYNLSEDVFNNVLHIPDAWWSSLPKVLIDQTVWTPFWNNTYIVLIGIMSRCVFNRKVFEGFGYDFEHCLVSC